MSYSNKEISSLIVDFLNNAISQKVISDDNADSLNVAIDCITEAFEVDRDDAKSIIDTKFNGKSLSDILASGVNLTGSGNAQNVKVNIPAEDAEIKAKAESMKLEGNKAMAGRDFSLAIQKYSEAIQTLPTNAIYYANRAAAHSSLKQYDEAIQDSEEAIKIDPAYSKGYSRLGFAKYAQGKPEEALEAYKQVLDIEGDKASDVMKRDYETAKKKVEQSLNLEKATQVETSENRDAKETASDNSEGAANPFAGGMPDMASMLGGGLGGGLGGLLNNPQLMQAAQQMMSDPNAMQKVQSMMQNPAVRQMAENFTGGNGGMPNMDDLMNNPAIRDMAGSLFGGANTGNQSPPKEDEDK
ncbi:similar to Saccharomyces cerevisiae YOR007C SGT2 Glutamine-rich cytoplasmic protein [Maudiozyma barnettii]|uniref:Similar to Saccharomyces cerevisiae YOR007C SGT2 Glutamine-rich cytoplasmic protein n=1 Tax=Maudiozyma barnettii TaxID=61262 RepID=A0A8H2ZI67_9SACH|nr:Sgt2p [Kazachstania barnettii]CAB4255563.1 similar to Saccharomyces cerevisiae YOR007C SGT2 Glutamine-rich cytoplasmic protein [Kazachstania barnettii]CAD1784061.1 similar to Saccharomyces cerevisiae YOR007C SGT2 Glutamine-rich cytoplasmic protein [Kazachstania barnettii]